MLSLIGGMFACPMCKDIVSTFYAHLSQGYFWSILLMLAMPALMVGVIVWRVTSAMRHRETH